MKDFKFLEKKHNFNGIELSDDIVNTILSFSAQSFEHLYSNDSTDINGNYITFYREKVFPEGRLVCYDWGEDECDSHILDECPYVLHLETIYRDLNYNITVMKRGDNYEIVDVVEENLREW